MRFAVSICIRREYEDADIATEVIGPFDDEVAAKTWRDRFIEGIPLKFRYDEVEIKEAANSKAVIQVEVIDLHPTEDLDGLRQHILGRKELR